MAEDVAALASPYSGLTRLVKATAGTYIGNNSAAIADYAARWDHGEIISFAESTVDLVVSRRFAKTAMQWSKKGAHLLLQTRTRTLDGMLHDLFTTWYPAMPANDVSLYPSLPQPELPPTVSVVSRPFLIALILALFATAAASPAAAYKGGSGPQGLSSQPQVRRLSLPLDSARRSRRNDKAKLNTPKAAGCMDMQAGTGHAAGSPAG